MKIAVLFEGPTLAAIKQVLSLVGDFDFVDNPHEAAVIIGEEPGKMAPYYCKEKEFIVVLTFGNDRRVAQQAKNVHEIEVTEFYKVMTLVFEKAKGGKSYKEKICILRAGRPGAKKVLIVEDTFKHQRSVSELLGEYDFTIATGYDDAMELLGSFRYDIVLTDMEMPMSTRLSAYILGKLVPYGLLIEKEAARQGVKYIGVVTDLDHHTDPFALAFDHLSRYSYEVNGAKVMYMHAPMTELDGERVKDWKTALERLTQ